MKIMMFFVVALMLLCIYLALLVGPDPATNGILPKLAIFDTISKTFNRIQING